MQHEIAVATLDGRAYYKIMTMLREIGMQFDDVKPGESLSPNIKLVITTEKEKNLIDFEAVLSIEELGEDPYVFEEGIIKHLYSDLEDSIIIGIDPGKRIGIAVYYGQKEVIGEVLNSVDETIAKIVKLIENTHAKKKIIRIGDGKPKMAENIADELSRRLKDAIIELVDERGTSSLSKAKSNKKVARDQRSAMIIALRQGKKYVGD
ncbi:MAG: hypothetical protein H3Z49_07125 [archaeon]|nr:hypothetical protein [archaeon]